MELLVVLVCLLVIGTPILAFIAFARVQRLTEQVQGARLSELIARVYALEQQLARLATVLPSRESPNPDSAAAADVGPAAPPALPLAVPLAWPAQPTAMPPGPTPPAPLAANLPDARPTPLASPFQLHPLPTGSKTSSPVDLENLIAGRWLNRIGILAVIIAVSFFLRYAFDNNWIGPSGRVAIGVLIGAALLPWSQWLLGKGYFYFSEGIAGLGEATLLLSIWAGCHYYSLFSNDVGFAGMIVVTAVMAIIALGRDSERIALLSLFGGFLTPLLLSTGKDEQVVLFTYLLILGGGLLIIGWRREWVTLAPASFFFTQIYFWGWYSRFYEPQKLGRTILFAMLFFLLHFALPVLRIIRFAALDPVGMLLVPANSLAYVCALYAMLWPQDRWPLTLLVLVLSAAHVAVARFVPPAKPGEWPVTQQLFAGLALTFATLAIPIRLEGKWITLALALEGAILIRTGYRALMPLLRNAGFLLLLVAALRVVFLPLPAQPFLLNERFGTYLGVIVSMAIALFVARRHGVSNNKRETATEAILGVAINLYTLLALSLELWDYLGHDVSLGIDTGLAQHLALSLLWTAYASILIMIGIRRQTPALRWQALVLFGLVVTKVFLYDSSYLERFYRILSFLILGLVLLIVSFLYQSKTSRGRASG
jgi:uncharacterized membrane protein